MKGTVKRWLRSYGFIESEEHDDDIFVHSSDVQGGSMLEEGQKVEFEVKSTYKGPRAINVKLVSE
ncbi:MAG: cold shock domain-containing protein [Candidatus Korarchaeota archaeon]|nr:cold shock domain-containing protein [Candidatus Korarchaeota archaeon]